MELIERISALEGEIKLVKSEIKKVLVDLRETMNTAENPFAHLEELRKIGGGNGVDGARLKTLEDTIEQLMAMDSGNGVEEERLKNLEDAMEQLKELVGDNGGDEKKLKNLEDTMEQLKELVGDNGGDEEKLKNLEDTMAHLKELGRVEVERLKNLEDAIEKLAEPETQSEKTLIHNPAVASELSVIDGENGRVDTITLAQLMQWADNTLNLIGMEKLNQILGLYELTGRLSKEIKNTIFKIADVPDATRGPKKERVETKHCVIALCELNRILTGEHQGMFTLSKETLLDDEKT